MGTLSDLLATRAGSGQSFAPSSVDGSFRISARQLTTNMWTRRDLLVDAHRDWHTRVNEVTQISNGNWYTVWPDLTREPSAPTVANIIEMGISHFGAIGGAVVPSVKVPVAYMDEGAEGRRGAAKRERRVRELRQKSNISELLARSWQDYAGTGTSFLGVWANFEVPEKERDPFYFRIDPRFSFVVKNEMGDVVEMLIARKRHSYDLLQSYPWLKTLFKDINQAEIEEWIWWDKDTFLHALADVSKKGREMNAGYIISKVDNRMQRIPVIEISRPTFDGERRGQFDQVIHIMRTQHYLMTLTIDASEQEVHPGIAGYEVENLQTYGAGATMRYRTAESKIDVFAPQQHFDIKDLIGRLEENARAQGVYPQQLTGEPGASIVSARGVKASMGALDARLALTHRQYEHGLAKLDGMLLQFDETYCDGEKTIHGDNYDRKKPEIFLPSRDIAGRYEVTVSYGLGAGSDPANREIRLHMSLEAGLIARQEAREQLQIEDLYGQEIQVFKESAYDAIRAGVLTMAAEGGDPTPAAHLLKLLSNKDADIEEVMAEMVEFLTAPPEQAGPEQGGNPMDAIAAGEALARGGGPNAEGLQGFGMPSLPAIAGEGAPAQVI